MSPDRQLEPMPDVEMGCPRCHFLPDAMLMKRIRTVKRVALFKESLTVLLLLLLLVLFTDYWYGVERRRALADASRVNMHNEHEELKLLVTQKCKPVENN
jgi:hypothetical protein